MDKIVAFKLAICVIAYGGLLLGFTELAIRKAIKDAGLS